MINEIVSDACFFSNLIIKVKNISSYFQLANVASIIQPNSVTVALDLPSLLEREDVIQQLERKETRKSDTRRSSLASQVGNFFLCLTIEVIFKLCVTTEIINWK